MITQIGNNNSPFIGGNPTPIIVETQSDLYPVSDVDLERQFLTIDIVNGKWKLEGITPSFNSDDYQVGDYISFAGEKVEIIAIDYINQTITIDYNANSITTTNFKRVFTTYKLKYDITTGQNGLSAQPLKSYSLENIPDLTNVSSIDVSSIARTRFGYDNKWERFYQSYCFYNDTDLYTPINITVGELRSYTSFVPTIPVINIELNTFYAINGNRVEDRGFYSKYSVKKGSNKKASFLRNSRIILYEPNSYTSDIKYNCDVAFLLEPSTSTNQMYMLLRMNGGDDLLFPLTSDIKPGYVRFNINNDVFRDAIINTGIPTGQNYVEILLVDNTGFIYIEDKIYFADKTSNSIIDTCNTSSSSSNNSNLTQVFVSYLTPLGSWETFLFRGLGSIKIETTNEQNRSNWIYSPNNTRNINNEVIYKTAVLGGTLRSLPLPQNEAISLMKDLFASLRVFDDKGNLLILDENSLTIESKDKNIAFSVDYKYSINPLNQRI